MPAPAAIIVSHGQPGGPAPPEADLANFAARVAGHLPGWHVASATLATPGALEAALAGSPGTPLVYPMFMSQGWFTQTQLPRRIGAHPARIMAPFGTDPGLPEMAAALLLEILDRQGWSPPETRLFLPGHGSGRSPNAARDTRAFASALGALIGFAEIRVGFVEQAPYLAETAGGLGETSICLPFFAAKLGHVLDDVPAALETAGFKGLALDPIGCAPGVPALVAHALHNSQAVSDDA